MTGMNRLLLDCIEMELGTPDDLLKLYIDVYDSNLSRKWLAALNELIKDRYHLEKNYCFFGFADGPRNGEYLIKQINNSIGAINQADLGYRIDDVFTLENTIDSTYRIRQDKFNQLHRYFEDLQGVSGQMSEYYDRADSVTRWHIRQLNLLCHEFESWILSLCKKHTAPDWQRTSQLMCWLRAPRFVLDDADYELFGIESINRPTGGVFIGVNKAIGKHHWEVFMDEGRRGVRVSELTTSAMRSQTEAAGDFDIEWANNPGDFPWQKKLLTEFRQWLTDNGFDPEDKKLTIGHPQVGQVDLLRSFGTTDYKEIWTRLGSHLNVTSIKTSEATATYDYDWSDCDFMMRQIRILGKQ
mgnify:FL=1